MDECGKRGVRTQQGKTKYVVIGNNDKKQYKKIGKKNEQRNISIHTFRSIFFKIKYLNIGSPDWAEFSCKYISILVEYCKITRSFATLLSRQGKSMKLTFSMEITLRPINIVST